MIIKNLDANDIDEATANNFARLLFALWAEKMTLAERVQEMKTAPKTLAGFRATVVYDGEKIIACSFGITRLVKIIAQNRVQRILALCGVGVDEHYRHRGFGKTVVEKQFSRVDNGEYEVAIFQTAIPEFYEKLSARRIGNHFINSTNEQSAFWEKYAMIYPQNYPWDDHGEVDLLGAGY